MKLTNAKLRNLSIGKKVSDGGGLYYQPTANNKGKWSYRFAIDGKSHEMGLGTYPEISLKEARLAHAEQRKVFISGRNPIETRRQTEQSQKATQARKFSDVAEMVIRAKRPAWTNEKSEKQWRSSLETYAYPILDKKPLAELTRADVLEVLEPKWNERTETMWRVRQRMRAVFAYAKTKGWYSEFNPAEWEHNLDTVLSRKRLIGHHESLPYNRLPWFYSSLQQFDTISAYALQFTILTAARTSEVRLARPEEIDFTGAIWNVPAERMKARASHRVPLSKTALQLIESVMRKHNQPFIFPSTKPEMGLSNGAMHQLIRKRYPNEKFTVHGFRTTFRIWAAEVGDYDQNLAEIALAHSQDKKVEGAYMRSKLIDKRREMMEDYAQFATSAMQQHCMIAH